MLNSAGHESFTANKYENANNSWHFHFYQQRNFRAQLYLARKNLKLLVIWDLFAGKISCSAELSMKKFYNLGTWVNSICSGIALFAIHQ